MDLSISLPDGTKLEGIVPVVVIGPNGSGKSRKVRELVSPAPIEFINALRNTRVAPQIPAMSSDDARNNFNNQRTQARGAHWELSSEFDSMLSQLLAQNALSAMDFVRAFRADPGQAGNPSDTTLSRVEAIWGQVFPGRELLWKDWKPTISSSTSGAGVEYSGNQMSDGEKAALFLAGRVFSAESGVLVVDEPETHLHSLLAVRLWNLFEVARSDIRFVYVTHDLTFALSRFDARYVIASLTGGLKAIDVATDLPKDVAEAILGSASLSFYASRIVFTEGEHGGMDDRLYSAWFNGNDTVVRPVGSCQTVLRCCEAMEKSGISLGLSALGIIDGDFHPAAFHDSQPTYVHSLKVHEVESLYSLPDLVQAVAAHLGKTDWNATDYRDKLATSITVAQRHAIIIDRWKAKIEPSLLGVTSGTGKRNEDIDSLVARIPDIFDYTKWDFLPQSVLEEEKKAVESVLPGGSSVDILRVAPGKPLIAVAAASVGMKVKDYADLIAKALAVSDNDPLSSLGKKIEVALKGWLPPRRVK
jgi:hypothetical protein